MRHSARTPERLRVPLGACSLETGTRILSAFLTLLLLAAGADPIRGQEERPTGTIIGLVYDSTSSAPLANATVAIMGTSAMTESDEEGQFRLDQVPAGEHMVSFFHPRLGHLGVSGTHQRIVVTGRSISEVYLTVPSRETILVAWCSGESGAGDTSVGGTVTDALTGVPLPGASVRALGARVGVLQRRRVVEETHAENSGEFRICKLDSADDIMIQTSFGANEGIPVEIEGSGPRILDLTISISEPVTITGTVTDYATKGPVEGARVALAGTLFSEFTDSAGNFGFVGVPPGKQIIETNQLGYASRIDSLTVFSNEALGLEIALSTEAIVLDPIVVTGRRRERDVFTTTGTRFSGLTEAQVDSIAPRVLDFASLARAARMPGLSITERWMPDAFGNLQMGVCIEMQRSRSAGGANTCNMVEVRINDGPVPDPALFLLQLNPQDIRRFQIITPIEAGLLYGGRGSNGVLLLYTR